MGRTVPAVMRAFDILELFTDVDDLSVPEMVERLGIPRTSVHELVGTLVERSYLAPVPGRNHRFRLGIAAHRLGAVYGERVDLSREGRAVATDLVADCGETVHVAVLEGTDVVYVAKVDGTHSVRMVSAVGRRLPAHCTAVGKMLLACLPDDSLDALFGATDELQGLTTRSITSISALREELQQIRQRGIAFDFCESNEAVACAAAVVRDQTGTAVAAISISVPIIRWSQRRAAELGRLVGAGAARLTRALGG